MPSSSDCRPRQQSHSSSRSCYRSFPPNYCSHPSCYSHHHRAAVTADHDCSVLPVQRGVEPSSPDPLVISQPPQPLLLRRRCSKRASPAFPPRVQALRGPSHSSKRLHGYVVVDSQPGAPLDEFSRKRCFPEPFHLLDPYPCAVVSTASCLAAAHKHGF